MWFMNKGCIFILGAPHMDDIGGQYILINLEGDSLVRQMVVHNLMSDAISTMRQKVEYDVPPSIIHPTLLKLSTYYVEFMNVITVEFIKCSVLGTFTCAIPSPFGHAFKQGYIWSKEVHESLVD